MLKTKVGLPLLVFVLLIFMVRLPFFICYVALLRLLLNPHWIILGWPHFMVNMLPLGQSLKDIYKEKAD